MRCEIYSELTINTLEFHQLVQFYINSGLQGGIEVNLSPSLNIRRETWRQILIAVTLFVLDFRTI